jgi:hypothetical protein
LRGTTIISVPRSLINPRVLTIGDTVSDDGTPKISIDYRRECKTTCAEGIQAIRRSVPWSLLNSEEPLVRCNSNPPIPEWSVKECRQRAGLLSPDVPLSLWKEVAGTDRSSLFMSDLKRSDEALWWFQHHFNARMYLLSDQASHFLEGCSGICDLCDGKRTTYGHVFFTCKSIQPLLKGWASRAPTLRWRWSLADWAGIPTSRYDHYSYSVRKILLQWLMEAIFIRRDAMRQHHALRDGHPREPFSAVPTMKARPSKGKTLDPICLYEGVGEPLDSEAPSRPVIPYTLISESQREGFYNTKNVWYETEHGGEVWKVEAGKETYYIETAIIGGWMCTCESDFVFKVCQHITDILRFRSGGSRNLHEIDEWHVESAGAHKTRYRVRKETYTLAGGRVRWSCNCPAGRVKKVCKHVKTLSESGCPNERKGFTDGLEEKKVCSCHSYTKGKGVGGCPHVREGHGPPPCLGADGAPLIGHWGGELYRSESSAFHIPEDGGATPPHPLSPPGEGRLSAFPYVSIEEGDVDPTHDLVTCEGLSAECTVPRPEWLDVMDDLEKVPMRPDWMESFAEADVDDDYLPDSTPQQAAEGRFIGGVMHYGLGADDVCLTGSVPQQGAEGRFIGGVMHYGLGAP